MTANPMSDGRAIRHPCGITMKRSVSHCVMPRAMDPSISPRGTADSPPRRYSAQYAAVVHVRASVADVRAESVSPADGSPKYMNCSMTRAGAPRPTSTNAIDSQRTGLLTERDPKDSRVARGSPKSSESPVRARLTRSPPSSAGRN